MIYLFITTGSGINKYEVKAYSMEEAIDKFSENYVQQKNREGIELAKKALHTMDENAAMEILNMAINGNLHTVFKVSEIVWSAYGDNDYEKKEPVN